MYCINPYCISRVVFHPTVHGAGIAILACAGNTHFEALVGSERDEVVEHELRLFLLEDRAAAQPVGEGMNTYMVLF